MNSFLDDVLRYKETPSYVKDVIRELQKKGLLSVGSVIKGMSIHDIQSALVAYESFMIGAVESGGVFDTSNNPSAESFLLFTDVLTIGEQLDLDENLRVIGPRMAYLNMFLGLELMVRGGVPISLRYEKMTMGDELKSSSEPLIGFKEGVQIPPELRAKISDLDLLVRTQKTASARKQEIQTEEGTSVNVSAYRRWLSE